MAEWALKNWLSEIGKHRKKIYSQCGEEGFIEFILQNTSGLKSGDVVVEFGAGDGLWLSNSFYFIKEHGFDHRLYDGDPKGSIMVTQQWIDMKFAKQEAIEINQTNMPVKLLLIDLDGNDWHILNTFLTHLVAKPDLVVCEINPIFAREQVAVMPYNSDHVWGNNSYYGMSLKAAEVMMGWHGYHLVFVNDSLNAYFLRRDLVKLPIPPVEYKVKRDHPYKSGIWLDERQIEIIRTNPDLIYMNQNQE